MNEELQEYLAHMASKLGSIDYGRAIADLVGALEGISSSLESISSNLSEIAVSLDSLDKNIDGCISVSQNGKSRYLCISGDVYTN